MRCSVAGIPTNKCLRDGWVFVPLDCKCDVHSPVEVLERAASIAPHPAWPLWIAIPGSSIQRGAFHTTLDLVGGVRADPNSPWFVRDAILGQGTARSMPCQGSILRSRGAHDGLEVRGAGRGAYRHPRELGDSPLQADGKVRAVGAELLQHARGRPQGCPLGRRALVGRTGRAAAGGAEE